MYAIYSEKQRAFVGLKKWKRENGEEVICTSVGSSPKCGCVFHDVQELGEVQEFLCIVELPDDSGMLDFPEANLLGY